MVEVSKALWTPVEEGDVGAVQDAQRAINEMHEKRVLARGSAS